MKTSEGAIIAACITAAASLIIYSFQQVRHIDERLDLLERAAAALITADGKVRPSTQAIENRFAIQYLEAHIQELKAAVRLTAADVLRD